ncbi:MAG: hypothetical protein K2I62_03070, partial [Alistipes sp.]|nr:hypothetical protein [Alistipes sp.]
MNRTMNSKIDFSSAGHPSAEVFVAGAPNTAAQHTVRHNPQPTAEYPAVPVSAAHAAGPIPTSRPDKS